MHIGIRERLPALVAEAGVERMQHQTQEPPVTHHDGTAKPDAAIDSMAARPRARTSRPDSPLGDDAIDGMGREEVRQHLGLLETARGRVGHLP